MYPSFSTGEGLRGILDGFVTQHIRMINVFVSFIGFDLFQGPFLLTRAGLMSTIFIFCYAEAGRQSTGDLNYLQTLFLKLVG